MQSRTETYHAPADSAVHTLNEMVEGWRGGGGDQSLHNDKKVYFDYIRLTPLSSIFSKSPLYHHLNLRDHNVTLTLITVLKLLSNYSSLISLSAGSNNSE